MRIFKNFNFFYQKLFLSFFLLFFCCLPLSGQAAQLSISSPVSEIAVDQKVTAQIYLDTQQENINALEGEITFSSNLSLQEIKDGNSVVTFWLNRPQLSAENKIAFAGVIPGGYQGQGFVFSVIFQVKKDGPGSLSVSQGKILLNDGQGTAAKFTAQNLTWQFVVPKTQALLLPPADSAVQGANEKISDHEAPESFVPLIARDDKIFDGQWFLSFTTQDKSSGLSHYEVRESREFGWGKLKLSQGRWLVTASPYVLQDQTLKSYLYVKAVDKAGNQRTVVLAPVNLSWCENSSFWGIIILGVIILFIFLFLWRKGRKK
jgi:hypothetical protein